jgi:hypothetical protein
MVTQGCRRAMLEWKNISLDESAADGKIYADKPNMRGDIQ